MPWIPTADAAGAGSAVGLTGERARLQEGHCHERCRPLDARHVRIELRPGQPDLRRTSRPRSGAGRNCWWRCAPPRITAGELTWPESWPAIPCHDLSGVVSATGRGPTAGDPATGLRPGRFRPARRGPPSTSRPRRRSGPQARLGRSPGGRRRSAERVTAWQALHQHARLAPGQHVLSTAAPAASAPTSSARGPARRPGDRYRIRAGPVTSSPGSRR